MVYVHSRFSYCSVGEKERLQIQSSLAKFQRVSFDCPAVDSMLNLNVTSYTTCDNYFFYLSGG